MIIRPSDKELTTVVRKIEQHPDIGFEPHNVDFSDSHHNWFKAPSIMICGPYRFWAKEKGRSFEYRGPYWAATNVVLVPRPGLFDTLRDVFDVLFQDDMLGRPSRIEGYTLLSRYKNRGLQGSLTLRYDFLPEQLPLYINQPRNLPYIVKFEVLEPRHLINESLYGSLGQRANLLLFPPPAYCCVDDKSFMRTIMDETTFRQL